MYEIFDNGRGINFATPPELRPQPRVRR
jgi:hypothetical protein